MMKGITCLLCLVTGISGIAQTNNQSALSIDQIMKGEDFVGYLPERIRWSEDSKTIYFEWNPDGDTLRSTYRAEVSSGNIEKLTFEELKELTGNGDFNRDHTLKVYEKSGDLFLMDLTNNKIKRITNTLDRESDPSFSGDGKSIIYREGDNLYQWDMEDGTILQLTNFKSGSERGESRTTPQEQWLENDQLALFDILEERENETTARNYRREQTTIDRPETIYFGENGLASITVSPDLHYVVYQLHGNTTGRSTIVPSYVTESGYSSDINSRPKVGVPQYSVETWILDLKADSAYRVKTDDIEGIYDKPAYRIDYADDPEEYKDKYEKPREVIVSAPVFSEDGKAVVNVSAQDYKDRWIMLLDLSTGGLKLIDRQHDDAWIAGPGIGWMGAGNIEWIDNENIWFQSEKTGYSHLYTANVSTGRIEALTEGDFEIIDVELSQDKQTFFIISNKESPHIHHFYHLPARGGRMNQITSLEGGHEVTVSPDETRLAIRYSYANKPWELYVMDNEQGAEMVRLTRSTTAEFNGYPWRVPEIIHFTASDGVEVPASIFKPAEDKKNGAAVIFVHGSGYLQNVHYWWPSYYREYMFNNLLADNGYTVLNIDFRASSGYGRDWRTAIYRHMGGRDLDDQVDGAKYLVEELGISREKIALYGGSYGGFITLMALFKYPGVFESGAALRSVTDWAHYNHYYTANILNTPVEDSLSYARSSPIYFADGLQDNLLMLHGMVDTNVHFQDIVRLSQRLIELGKENWELAVFPLENHGFVESSSWSDEYRRIFRLFQETLQD